MLNIIKQLIKKIIFSFLFIYAFNVVLYPLNMVMPINVINVILVTFFGFSYIIGFSIFSLLFF